MKAKLGQDIKFKHDHKIKLASGGTVLVKAGDTAKVIKKIDDSNAQIMYLTGAAKGKYQNIQLQVEDALNADEMAKKILGMMNNG
jgi:hypothetical protein